MFIISECFKALGGPHIPPITANQHQRGVLLGHVALFMNLKAAIRVRRRSALFKGLTASSQRDLFPKGSFCPLRIRHK